MYRLISKLSVYKNLEEDNILVKLSGILFEIDYHKKDNRQEERLNGIDKDMFTSRIYTLINELLDVSTIYGFDQNLWQNYLAYTLASTENPFTITCEKAGARQGTVNRFAKADFKIFLELFHYDFSGIEEELGINCFSIITDYKAIEKSSGRYNKSVSEKVRILSANIASAKDEDEVFQVVTNFYKDYGVGKLGLNKAFRLSREDGKLELVPITNTVDVRLSNLVGYELQKQKLIDNTRAFVEGKKANNVLLFGDSGTGKSTSVKAILNEYYDKGLRMIEIYKHQFEDLSTLISIIKNRNYKFIIYMDDLSFEDFEIEYKYLKAVIEGGLENKPDNVLIYATSNRRHLIRETWKDRSDMEIDGDIHRSDTMEEKLSLVDRFGITINFSSPSQKEYLEIVKQLAIRQSIRISSEEELFAEARKWELHHGGLSGRTAQQFINYLAGKD
ncbi:MAG: ATP-binding protein [Clostridiales bacterium]|jgi:predicted AAA+ superfamily ATPase|nr:ATP-binding protein [Clostridiales bacterium]